MASPHNKVIRTKKRRIQPQSISSPLEGSSLSLSPSSTVATTKKQKKQQPSTPPMKNMRRKSSPMADPSPLIQSNIAASSSAGELSSSTSRKNAMQTCPEERSPMVQATFQQQSSTKVERLSTPPAKTAKKKLRTSSSSEDRERPSSPSWKDSAAASLGTSKRSLVFSNQERSPNSVTKRARLGESSSLVNSNDAARQKHLEPPGTLGSVFGKINDRLSKTAPGEEAYQYHFYETNNISNKPIRGSILKQALGIMEQEADKIFPAKNRYGLDRHKDKILEQLKQKLRHENLSSDYERQKTSSRLYETSENSKMLNKLKLQTDKLEEQVEQEQRYQESLKQEKAEYRIHELLQQQQKQSTSSSPNRSSTNSDTERRSVPPGTMDSLLTLFDNEE